MSKIKLTLGIPTHTDFKGCWHTIQAFRAANYYQPWIRNVEILIVDNAPMSEDGQLLQHEMKAWWQSPRIQDVRQIRYVGYPEPQGPANCKDQVFRQAEGEIVLCIDSHVICWNGMVDAILAFYENPERDRDMLCGPMIYGDLATYETHMRDQWRGQMWGTWAHDARGADPLGEPFEIEGQGCGLMVMRKDAWFGFPENLYGFGGEELCAQHFVRQGGGKVWCHPALRWVHCYGKPGGHKGPLSIWHKTRNYIILLTKLGIPLDRCYRHFVEGWDEDEQGQPAKKVGSRLNKLDWNVLTHDPLNPPVHPMGAVVGPSQGVQMTTSISTHGLSLPSPRRAAELRDMPGVSNRFSHSTTTTPEGKPGAMPDRASKDCSEETKKQMNLPLETLYQQAIASEGKKHEGYIRQLNAMVTGKRVVDISRHQWLTTVAIAYGGPKTLTIYADATNGLLEHLPKVKLQATESIKVELKDIREGVSNPFDFLYLDLPFLDSTVKAILQSLSTNTPAQIVVGNLTQETRKAVSEFCSANPNWFIRQEWKLDTGMVLISSIPEERPTPAPEEGPGKELKLMLESIGITEKLNCDCNGKMAQMNLWGISGCRKNRNTIIGWMRDGAKGWGWLETMAAAAKAVSNGLAFHLNWADPFPSLVDEAIRRAEAKEGSQ